MKSVSEELGSEGLESFARAFLDRYQQAGFGRLPKREIDVLVLHLLERYAPRYADESDTALARQLGTTPSRVKGWRTDARYLYWSDDDQLELVRRTVFGAIANDAYTTEADTVIVEVYDAFVKQQVVDILRKAHQLHDTSFNSSLLKLSRNAFWSLVAATLPQSQVDLLLADTRFRGATDRQTLTDKIREMTTGTAKDLTNVTGQTALKRVAGLVVGGALL